MRNIGVIRAGHDRPSDGAAGPQKADDADDRKKAPHEYRVAFSKQAVMGLRA
jgi:hypothetical protein